MTRHFYFCLDLWAILSVLMISMVEVLLGISSLSACFDYNDIVERLTLRNELMRLSEMYPEHYGQLIASWSSMDMVGLNGSCHSKLVI